MPVYKIHRLRDSHREHFRWAPHAAGSTQVKLRDYEPGGQIEAASPYSAWVALKESPQPLRIGDILECETGALCICKYVGFEDAQWVVPEPKAT